MYGPSNLILVSVDIVNSTYIYRCFSIYIDYSYTFPLSQYLRFDFVVFTLKQLNL